MKTLLPLSVAFVVSLLFAGCGGGDDAPSEPDAPTGNECTGCYVGDSCVAGDSTEACGRGGTDCYTCIVGDSCQEGICIPAGLTCDSSNCAGCCAADGTCETGNQDTTCGTGGRLCRGCSAGDSCQAGACKSDGGCDPDCEGCCDAGVCKSGLEQNACGAEGATCQTCAVGYVCGAEMPGGACVGDPNMRWDVILLSATVPPLNAEGDNWDSFGGLPDVAGRVYYATSGGAIGQVNFDEVDDTLTPNYNNLATLTNVPGDRFGFAFKWHLWDEDVLSNDYIGFCPPGYYGAAPVDFSGATLECKVEPDLANGESGFSVRYKFVPHQP